jgi:hypothetical protein
VLEIPCDHAFICVCFAQAFTQLEALIIGKDIRVTILDMLLPAPALNVKTPILVCHRRECRVLLATVCGIDMAQRSHHIR